MVDVTTYRLRPYVRPGIFVISGLVAALCMIAIFIVTLVAPSWRPVFAVITGVVLIADLAISMFTLVGLRPTITLTCTDDAVSIQTRSTTQQLKWSQIRQLEGDSHTLIFHTSDDKHIQLTSAGPAGGSWSQLCEDLAHRLDLSRGYENRLCESPVVPTGGCSNPLGCAGSDTCALHALKHSS